MTSTRRAIDAPSGWPSLTTQSRDAPRSRSSIRFREGSVMDLHTIMTNPLFIGAGALLLVFVVVPTIVAAFLRDVDAGTIRLVSWITGGTVIYRGPGKSKEIPLLTTGTTISSKVINVDLDITDQTADVDETGRPQPIKIRVLASAIVSVGDSDVMVRT